MGVMGDVVQRGQWGRVHVHLAATNNKQQTTNNKQQTTNNKQQTTNVPHHGARTRRTDGETRQVGGKVGWEGKERHTANLKHGTFPDKRLLDGRYTLLCSLGSLDRTAGEQHWVRQGAFVAHKRACWCSQSRRTWCVENMAASVARPDSPNNEFVSEALTFIYNMNEARPRPIITVKRQSVKHTVSRSVKTPTATMHHARPPQPRQGDCHTAITDCMRPVDPPTDKTREGFAGFGSRYTWLTIPFTSVPMFAPGLPFCPA